MRIENQYSYQTFLQNWECERDSLTPEEVDQLVKELAESYYSARIKYAKLVERMQIALQEER